MQSSTCAAPREVALAASRFFQQCAQDSVRARGRFAFALSGGRTPWLMLEVLSGLELPWTCCHLFQADERVAPVGDEARNLTRIERGLLRKVPIPAPSVHPMPVRLHDLPGAAEEYSATLTAVCGSPPILDLIVLGLGADGHTASLVPGDPVLHAKSKSVGTTRLYQGTRRMTLTFPVLNRARQLLWLVTGKEKAGVLKQLLDGDPSIPAGRVCRHQAMVITDEAAAANSPPGPRRIRS